MAILRKAGPRVRACGALSLAALVLVQASVVGAAPSGRDERAARYVMRFAAAAEADEREAALQAVGAAELAEVSVLRLVLVYVDPSGAEALGRNPLVEWIHRERTVSVAAGVTNDPLLDRQWALKKTGAFKGWKKEDGSGSDPVVVAIVDSGVDPSHPDLQDRLLDGFDFVNIDRDPADDHGHGTHVAGVIAAHPDNRKGIAGLSWGARILPLKACDLNGACSNFAVVQSIVWAIQNGAKVVNLSLGGAGQECAQEYELARDLAEREGVLLIASAGNSGAKGGENPVNFPAACEGYVSVAATGPNDEWAPFSTHNEHVDVAAPGMGVVSTLPPALTMEDDPTTHGYGPADGTSMASPHVSGLAALLFAQHPEWTAADVTERIETTSVDLGKRGRDPYFGAGRIDVAAALGASR